MGLVIVVAFAFAAFSITRAVATGFGEFVAFACRHPSRACFLFAILFFGAGLLARACRLS